MIEVSGSVLKYCLIPTDSQAFSIIIQPPKHMAAGTKFMQVLDPKIYRRLRSMAKPLGVTVQELIRVKVIPEFIYGPIALNPQLVKKLLKQTRKPTNRTVQKLVQNGELPVG
jgi:hypothetical protein